MWIINSPPDVLREDVKTIRIMTQTMKKISIFKNLRKLYQRASLFTKYAELYLIFISGRVFFLLTRLYRLMQLQPKQSMAPEVLLYLPDRQYHRLRVDHLPLLRY